MSLETATTARPSSGTPASHAPVASTIAPASTEPDGVRTIPRSRSSSTIGERSKIRTPRPTATRRRPRASSAGCTVAAPGLEGSPEVDGRARAPLHLLGGQDLERLLARAGGGRDSALPRAELGRRGRRPEPAAAAVVRVDPSALAERAELVHRLHRGADEPEGLLLPGALDQRLDLRPPGEREAAVSARRAAAADVRLDEHDRRARLELGDPEGRPEAGVAAADDAHVGADGLGELRGVDAVLGRERLLEPERPGRHPA